MKTLFLQKNKTYRIISLTLLFVLFFTKICSCYQTTIEIADSRGKIYKELVLLEPKSIVEQEVSNDDDFITITGKICYVNDTQRILKDCFEKFENFNYAWVIL